MVIIEASIRKFPDIEEIVKSEFSLSLEQGTKDTVQLNPVERLNSITKVWDTCKNKIGNPALALDVGSGFGYGTVFLESQNIKTIGIENVGKKIKQGQELFRLIGLDIPDINKLDFSKHPAFYEGDINAINDDIQVDLITLFYLSLEMVSRMKTFETLQKLLKKDGTVLLATEANIEDVQAVLKSNFIPVSFSHEIIEVPDNFEKTAILLKLK